MGFLIRDCVRCGVKRVQMQAVGKHNFDGMNAELQMVCSACGRSSLYIGQPVKDPLTTPGALDLERQYGKLPIMVHVAPPEVSEHIPPRVAGLFTEAAITRRLKFYEASGTIFRKTIDVATKHLYKTDPRLEGKNPANAARARIKSLGEMGILDADIVELADVAVLDGNDAAHDVDPYTAAEAEALEELTVDLLDRLFVRPAKLAAVRAKQVAAGQREA